MKLIIAALAVCFASAANALTVTFDIDPANDPVINSYTYQGTSQGYYFNYSFAYNPQGVAYLHDDNGTLSSTIRPVDGTKFSVFSVDLYSYSLMFMTGSGAAPTYGTAAHNQWLSSGTAPVPTMTFAGIVNGATIATQTFSPTAWSTVNFTKAFTAIDQLLVTLNIPTATRYASFGHLGPNEAWCAQWCAGAQIDNLVVAPVPLPATGWMLFGAVLSLIGYRRSTAR